MGKLVGSTLLFLTASVLVLVLLFHLIFSLPIWLLIGGVAAYVWLRRSGRGTRLLGRGRRNAGYISGRSRW